MKFYDVVIVGGGAAGMMCAITAANRGRSVMLIEHTKRLGKKILMSGGGRCNFTNLDINASQYLSNNPHFCKSALQQYTQWNFIALVEKHGIEYYEKTLGQLFCVNSSKDIVQMLEAECLEAGVTIKTQCTVNGVQSAVKGPSEKTQYQITTNLGTIMCQSLVIASGGLSIPTLGATGFGYKLAEQFGLQVLPTRASLVPFTLTGPIHEAAKKLSGVSIDCQMSNEAMEFELPLLFTHRGLSGPATLQISNYWQPSSPIAINFLPNEDLGSQLLEYKKAKPNTLLRSALQEYLPKTLVLELQTLLWQEYAERPLQRWSQQELQQLGTTLNRFELTPSGTEGYRTAEVTAGGIDTQHLSSKTLECQEQSGLYFIGEVVDVTGWLGGYNFQWAWSSGYVAGLHA